MKILNHAILAAACGVLALGTIAASPATAESVADFYKGKSVTVTVGSAARGSINLNARIITRHLGKHIPGNPTIVVQNMPGAGSVVLGNFLHAKAPKDGTYIGALNRSALFNRVYFGKTSKAQYGPDDLVYLGSPNKIWSVAYSWHTQKVKTYKDLYKHELICGGSGGTTVYIPEMHKEFTGMKFKVVKGYKSGGEVDLAAERGEVGCRASAAPANLLDFGWIQNKKINVLFWNGLEVDKKVADVPLGVDLVKKDEDRKLMKLFFGADEMGYPYAVPKGVPADRVAALRKALLDTFKDPDYVKDAAKAKLEVHPVSPERMTEIIQTAYGAPQAMQKRLQDVLASDRMKDKKMAKKK